MHPIPESIAPNLLIWNWWRQYVSIVLGSVHLHLCNPRCEQEKEWGRLSKWKFWFNGGGHPSTALLSSSPPRGQQFDVKLTELMRNSSNRKLIRVSCRWWFRKCCSFNWGKGRRCGGLTLLIWNWEVLTGTRIEREEENIHLLSPHNNNSNQNCSTLLYYIKENIPLFNQIKGRNWMEDLIFFHIQKDNSFVVEPPKVIALNIWGPVVIKCSECDEFLDDTAALFFVIDWHVICTWRFLK